MIWLCFLSAFSCLHLCVGASTERSSISLLTCKQDASAVARSSTTGKTTISDLIEVVVCLNYNASSLKALVVFQGFSIWCTRENSGRGTCRSCYLPRWGQRFQQSPVTAIIRVYTSDGQLVEEKNIAGNASDCKSRGDDHIRSRPKLHTSFVVNGTERVLSVRENESVEQAAGRFLRQYNLVDNDSGGHNQWLTENIESAISLKKTRRRELRREVLRRQDRGLPIQIVFGASVSQTVNTLEHFGPSFIAFDINSFDLLDEEDFLFYFGMEGSVDAMVTEHVFEHLDIKECLQALRLCRKYLKKTTEAYMRLAVPDWWRYPENTTTAFYAADIRDGHFVQYNLDSLGEMLTYASFQFQPREYNNGSIKFSGSLDPLKGMIKRSFCFDHRGVYSLVVDAWTHEPPSWPATTPTGTSGEDAFLSTDQCGVQGLYEHGLMLAQDVERIADATWYFRLALNVMKIHSTPAGVDKGNLLRKLHSVLLYQELHKEADDILLELDAFEHVQRFHRNSPVSKDDAKPDL